MWNRLMRRAVVISTVLVVSASPASAVERWVAVGGSNTSTCTDMGNPCATVQYAIQDVRCDAGDIINVRAGTYAGGTAPDGPGDVSDNNVVFCSGTSYANAVTVRTYPGDLPSRAILRMVQLNHATATPAYHIWENITVLVSGSAETGGYACFRVAGAHHIRVLNLVASESDGPGCVIVASAQTSPNGMSSAFIEILGTCTAQGVCTCDISNSGIMDNLHHGIYMSGVDSIITGCAIHDNKAWGIHIYEDEGFSQLRNHVYGNYVYNNGLADPNGGGIFCCGDGSAVSGDALIYNNVIYNNHDGLMFGNATTSQAYHNTIVGNTRMGVDIRGIADVIDLRNNIIRDSGSFDWNIVGNLDSGDYTQSSNVCIGQGTVAHPSCDFNFDPGFTNIAGGDFTLASGTSPAVDVGADLSGIITTDFLGDPRPLDGPDADTVAEYDLGAHEFTEGGSEDPPPSCSTGFTGAITVVGCAYSRSDTPQLAVAGPIDTTLCDMNCAYLVVLAHDAGTVPTLSDSTGMNTYTCPAATIVTDTTASLRICYVTAPVTNAALTVTASSGATSYPIVFVLAVEHVAAMPVGQSSTATAGATVTSLQTGSMTPATNNQLLVTGIVNTGTCGPHTINSAFVRLGDVECSAETRGGSMAYLGQSGAAAVNPTWTWTIGDSDVATAILSLQSSTETPPSPTPTRIRTLTQ